jgi:hypothetical protein
LRGLFKMLGLFGKKGEKEVERRKKKEKDVLEINTSIGCVDKVYKNIRLFQDTIASRENIKKNTKKSNKKEVTLETFLKHKDTNLSFNELPKEIQTIVKFHVKISCALKRYVKLAYYLIDRLNKDEDKKYIDYLNAALVAPGTIVFRLESILEKELKNSGFLGFFNYSVIYFNFDGFPKELDSSSFSRKKFAYHDTKKGKEEVISLFDLEYNLALTSMLRLIESHINLNKAMRIGYMRIKKSKKRMDTIAEKLGFR